MMLMLSKKCLMQPLHSLLFLAVPKIQHWIEWKEKLLGHNILDWICSVCVCVFSKKITTSNSITKQEHCMPTGEILDSDNCDTKDDH